MKNDRTRFDQKFQFFEKQTSSPLSAQILEFWDSELFQETIQNSEAASCSNYYYEEQSSYSTNLDLTKCPILPDNTTTSNNIFASIFDEGITENDISTPIFTNHQYPFSDQGFDISMLQNQIIPKRYNNHPSFSYPQALSNDRVGPIVDLTTLPNVCDENSLSLMPPYKFMRLNKCLSPNYSLDDPSITSYLPLSTNYSGIINEKLLLGHEIQGDHSRIFCNPNELQALSEENHLVNGGGSYTTPLVSEVTSLGSESYKVTNKLTSEERKEKIHKYLKKRNERNFKKKIKYACRKSLADSRPRVRGRFAKNDDFGENNRTNNNNDVDAAEDVRSFHHI